jgi:lipid-binding SYLF domain-containing protein
VGSRRGKSMTQKIQSDKQRHKKPLYLWMTALLFSCFCWTPAWANGLDEQQLVEKAKHTVESFMGDPNFTWFRDHVKNANALLIIPQQLKAAFWFGVDGGSGVLVTRDEQTGAWSEPAFYDLGGLSFGFQFGGEASEVIILAMTQGAVEKLYASSFKLGGDASIAAGPYGAGAEGATSANLDADFLSFSRSKGVYAGISLEGSIIYVNDDANEAYYGKKVRPVDILVIKSVKNKHSAGLRQAIMTATK